jgi:hypothetical protein
MATNSDIRIGIAIEHHLLPSEVRAIRALGSRYPRGSVGVQASKVTLLEERKGGISATLYARGRVGAARHYSLT